MKKKNLLKLVGIIVGVLIIIALVILLIVKMTNGNTKDYQKEVENNIKNLVKDFYEGNYYNDTDKKLIESFSKDGLKVSLNTLYVVSGNKDKVKNPKTEKECDAEKTYVMIYPKSPYGKSNYDIKYYLNCGELK